MPPEENKSRTPIKSLRTYQGDVEEAIGKNKFSTTSVFVAEQKRKIENPEKVIEKTYNPVRNKVFMYFGGIFFMLGLIAVASVYYIRSSEQTIIEQQTKTLISFSKEKDIDVASSTRESLISILIQEKDNFKSPINSVLYINTMDGENPSNIENVFTLLGPNQPGVLTRAIDKDYMIGVYSENTNEIFIIVKIKDYASSYSGMLKWEKDMPKDLAKIFSIENDLISTTSPFTDEAIKNKDLRTLKDLSGKTQLLYSFIDKETLVITKNENVFNAIMSKYNISKQVK